MRKIPQIISQEEFINILKATKHKHHQIAFALGFYNCLRVSEIINLKQEDIDKDRKLLHIIKAKGNKDRNIPIAPEVINGLRNIPLNITKRALQYAFKHKAIQILNKDLHFHTLRHSGATYYLNEKKWDIRQLQVFLGHSRINMTELYTHVNPQNLIDLMWK